MLFDGIRDQKLNVKWVGTPQAIVTKVMVARQLRDKVPKGEYVIRASVLDRLIQNKMEYKFIEYGNKMKDIKAKEKIEADKAKVAKEEADKKARLDAILNTEGSGKVSETFKLEESEESEEDKMDVDFDDSDSVKTSENYVNSSDEEDELNPLRQKSRHVGFGDDDGEVDQDEESGQPLEKKMTSFEKASKKRQMMKAMSRSKTDISLNFDAQLR